MENYKGKHKGEDSISEEEEDDATGQNLLI